MVAKDFQGYGVSKWLPRAFRLMMVHDFWLIFPSAGYFGASGHLSKTVYIYLKGFAMSWKIDSAKTVRWTRPSFSNSNTKNRDLKLLKHMDQMEVVVRQPWKTGPRCSKREKYTGARSNEGVWRDRQLLFASIQLFQICSPVGEDFPFHSCHCLQVEMTKNGGMGATFLESQDDSP